MKTTGIASLKARLSHYLEAVKHGQEVVVTERGQPVARIVPIRGSEERGSRVERLARAGLLQPGRGRLPASVLKPPKGDRRIGRAVLAALLEERAEGR